MIKHRHDEADQRLAALHAAGDDDAGPAAAVDFIQQQCLEGLRIGPPELILERAFGGNEFLFTPLAASADFAGLRRRQAPPDLLARRLENQTCHQ